MKEGGGIRKEEERRAVKNVNDEQFSGGGEGSFWTAASEWKGRQIDRSGFKTSVGAKAGWSVRRSEMGVCFL